MGFLLTPEEIGDNLDLEVEGTYPCSDGSKTMTISVDRLLKAQLKKTLISIGKEARRMDNTTYLVPDYSKYRQAVKEAGIEEIGETEE